MTMLELFGCRARIIAELDIGEGRTVNVRITDDCTMDWAGTTLSIALRPDRIERAIDDAGFRGLDR